MENVINISPDCYFSHFISLYMYFFFSWIGLKFFKTEKHGHVTAKEA